MSAKRRLRGVLSIARPESSRHQVIYDRVAASLLRAVVTGTSFGTLRASVARSRSFRDAALRQEVPDLQVFLRWRDPDSNRGHHDFQGVAVRRDCSRKTCISVCSPSRCSAPRRSVSIGLVCVWDCAGASKSQWAEADPRTLVLAVASDVAHEAQRGAPSGTTVLPAGLVRRSDPRPDPSVIPVVGVEGLRYRFA
jgi:hypothetical protein